MIDFSAVHTSTAVYIVGGLAVWAPGGLATRTRVPGNEFGIHNGVPTDHYSTNIAKYENGVWSMAGNLQHGIHTHTAVLLGEEIHVGGGYNNLPGSRYVQFINIQYMIYTIYQIRYTLV